MPEPGRVSSFEDRRAATELLIARAVVEPQQLSVLLGYELCALDGPGQVLADEQLLQAWVKSTERTKSHLLKQAFRRLDELGLLLGPVQENDPIDEQVIHPELGIVLAARTRPGFAVLAQRQNSTERTIKMFSVAQDDDPMRALVVETPEAPIGVSRKGQRVQRALGPLTWLYSFLLASPPFAASMLASWIIQPHNAAPSVVTVLRHRAGEQLTIGSIAVRGDGARGSVLGPNGEPSHSRSRTETELTEMMADLLASAAT